MDKVLFLNRATDISVSTVSAFFSKLMNKGNISTCAQYHFQIHFIRNYGEFLVLLDIVEICGWVIGKKS